MLHIIRQPHSLCTSLPKAWDLRSFFEPNSKVPIDFLPEHDVLVQPVKQFASDYKPGQLEYMYMNELLI